MMNRENLIYSIRRFQTVASIIIFVMAFALCWASTKFNLTEIQLSTWSTEGFVGTIWNMSLMLLGITVLLNQWHWIKSHRRISNKLFSQILFLTSGVSLFFTGFFNLNYPILHNIFALYYFFSYPLIIFTVAYVNRKSMLWSNWMHMTILSTAMISIPMILIPIWNGMAISELVHSILVIYWNLWILIKKFN